jgi:hypothetical protein
LGDVYSSEKVPRTDQKAPEKVKQVAPNTPFLRKELISDKHPLKLEGFEVYFPYAEPYEQQKLYMEHVLKAL